MADINNAIITTENNLISLLRTFEKLNEVVNKDLVRIDSAIIGEENLKEEEQTINIITSSVSKLNDEVSSLKGIKIDAGNVDSISEKINSLSEQIERLYDRTNQTLHFAAENILSDFDTSLSNSLKSKLNEFHSSMLKDNNGVTNFNESSGLLELQGKLVDSDNTELKTYIEDSKKRKEYQRELVKQIYETAKTDNLSNIKNKDEGIANMDTVARAIITAVPKAKEEVIGLVNSVDQLTHSMAVLTETKAVDATDIVDLMFGRNIKVDLSDKIEEQKQAIEEYKQYMQTEFPSGRKFVPDETIYASEKELHYWYDENLKQLNEQKQELDRLIALEEEAKSKVPALLDMYYQGKATHNSSLKYQDAADLMFNGSGTWQENVINATSPYKLEDTETQIKQIRDKETALKELKETEEKLLDNKYLKVAPNTQNIISDENTLRLLDNRRKQLEYYNNFIKDISNTDLSKSTENNFDDKQIRSYVSSLDSVIKKGNELRESIVKDFNTINGENALSNVYLGFNKDEFINIVNTAKSGMRNSIEDAETIQKLNIIDDIVRDIVDKAGSFKINISDDVVVQAEKIRQLNLLRERASKFVLDDRENKYVENAYSLQRLEQEISIFEKLKAIVSDTNKQEFNIDSAKTYDEIIKGLTKQHEKLTDSINETKQEASQLGRVLPEISNNVKITEPTYYLKQLKKIRNEKINAANEAYEAKTSGLNKNSNDAQVQAQIANAEKYRSQSIKKAKDEYDELSKSVGKVFIDILREQERVEQEQTRIAQQQAQERIRIAQDEHQEKMSFFDKEYIYNGKKYSTSEQLGYFKNYANNIKNSNNFIGMPEVQTQQYEQAMSKVRSLQVQLENEQKQSIENIKNKVQEACQFIISAVSKAIDIVKFAISSIGKTFTIIINAFRSIGSIASRIIGLLGNFANRVRECTKTTNLLKGSWTELHSAISLISGALNKLTNNQFINEGKKLLSSIETLNTLIGKDLTQSTIDWANNLEGAFGIDSAGLVADMREVAGVLKGLGMTAEDVAVASQNLVSVGQTMSAVIGLDEQTVMNKIYSGMRGMTVAIDDIGLSVRETQMNNFLKEVKAMGGEYANIGTSFANLSEQQRVYVRYAGLMKQFMDVYTPEAYAKSLDSITGRLNILSQRFRALKQLIGNFAIQIFNKFVLPLTYAVDLLTAKLKSVFSGIMKSMDLNPEDLDLSTGMNHTTVSADDLADAYDGVAESAEKAAKASAGLDEFDHVSTLGSSSSSSSSDNFDYTKLMKLGDNYAEKLGKLAKEQANFYKEKTKKAWEELKEQIKNDFNTWYKEVTGRDFDAKFNLSANWTQIKNIAKNIKDIFKKVFSTGLGIGAMIADDLDIGKIITKTLYIVENITAIISKAVEKISPYIIKFYEQCIKPYVEKFGEFIDKHLNTLIIKTTQWRAFWETGASDKWLSDNSESWFESISNWIDKAIEKVKLLWAVIKPLFTGEVTLDDKVLVKDSDSTGTLSNVQDTLLYIHSIIKDIASVAGEIAVDFANWFTTTGSSEIKDMFKRLSDFFSNHKEDIKVILETIAQAKWDIFKTIFDKALELGEWLTEHSEIVTAFIKDIERIIKFIVKHIVGILALGIIAKIGMAGTKLLWILSLLKGSNMLGAVGKIGTKIKGWFTGIGPKITKVAGKITTKIGGVCSTVGTKIKGWFTGIGPKITKLAGKITTKIGGACSTIGSTIAGWVSNFELLGATGASALGAATGIGTLAVTGGIAAYRGFNDTMDQAKLTNAVDKDNKFNSSDIIDQAAATVKRLREVYGDALSDDMFIEAIRTLELCYKKSGEYTEQEIKNAIDLYAYEIDQYSDSWDFVLNIQGDGWSNFADTVVDNMYKLEDTTEEVAETVSTETTSMNTNLSSFGNGVWTSEKNISNASISINSSLESIKSTFESLKTLFKEKITANFNAEFNAKTKVNTDNIKWTNGIKTNGLNTFYAHANGGVPKSGSLFMANENGESELVGNFGGYTGVANQNMIMQAMENAVARGISKASVNSKSGSMTFNICQGGMFVGDQSSVRKLANMINSTNSATNKTIANSAFSMN